MNEISTCRSVWGFVCLILYLFLFLETEYNVAQAGLEPLVFLPLSPGCWEAIGMQHTIQFTLQEDL